MKLTEMLAAQLEREAPITRKALERVPEGKPDWKPHEKSMPLGYLAQLVATMPGWIAMMLTQDYLDLRPPGGGGYTPPRTDTTEALLAAFDASVTRAREALAATDDAHLMTKWQLRVGGQVVLEATRLVNVMDTFTHLAHHRGQLTVYLRLNEVAVPSIYGPSADDRTF
jgi:uncharacterized damage-inducible protein DinB